MQRAKPSPLDPPPARPRRPDGRERFATRIKKPAAAPSSPQSQPPPLSSAPPKSTTGPSPTGSSSAAAAPSRVPLEEEPEYRYLRSVLERGGYFMRAGSSKPRPCRSYYSVSSSAPVDPIVFHLLELELPADDEARLGPLRHRWNRKLLFHLAQEVLAEELRLPGAAAAAGPPLLRKVWAKVRSFPAADCRVVGDIDALVAADLMESPPSGRYPYYPAVAEEEAEDVAEEVADRVMEALLGECVGAVAESASLSSRSAARAVTCGNGGESRS